MAGRYFSNDLNKSIGKEWVGRWQLRHAQLMVLFTTGCALLFLSKFELNQLVQLIILGTGVAFLGLPHGALDHIMAKPIFQPRFKNGWPLAFLVYYLSLIAVVLLCWWVNGPLALATFLIFSALHFGLEDVHHQTSTNGYYWLEVAARGSMPVIIPLHFYNATVVQIFADIIPNTSIQTIDAFISPFSKVLYLTLVPTLILFTLYHLKQASARGLALNLGGIFRDSERQLHLTSALEISSLGLFLASAPPLASFVLYFCGWHSIRHTLELAALLNPRQPLKGLRQFAILAAPLTGLTILGAGTVLLFRANTTGYYGPSVQIIFVTLSALTFPHMGLRAAIRRQANCSKNNKQEDVVLVK